MLRLTWMIAACLTVAGCTDEPDPDPGAEPIWVITTNGRSPTIVVGGSVTVSSFTAVFNGNEIDTPAAASWAIDPTGIVTLSGITYSSVVVTGTAVGRATLTATHLDETQSIELVVVSPAAPM
ncbi:MAG: hypothetical protein IPQ07_06275 [Myxococcales bacterium]|nr:hypothetical protein [Myxococcales bacterium]